jgi:hypothetical protein
MSPTIACLTWYFGINMRSGYLYPKINGKDVMQNTTEFSEAKRALLEKFLRGEIPQFKTDGETIHQRSREKDPPLSFGQQQLWLLAQLIPDIPAYNECVTLRMPGPLDIVALERSLNELLERHEAWRTRSSSRWTAYAEDPSNIGLETAGSGSALSA